MPTAVVTGAGSGLGRAIAVDLTGRGFRVHVTDLDGDAAARTAAEIGAGGASWALDALGTMNGTVAALERMIPTGRGHVINVIESSLDDPDAALSFAGQLLTPGRVAKKLIESGRWP